MTNYIHLMKIPIKEQENIIEQLFLFEIGLKYQQQILLFEIGLKYQRL